MVLKHLVDRYSIYYLYSTSVISPNIHQTAITFVLISFFFMLLQLTAFLNTRNDFTFQFQPSNMCTLALILYVIFLSFTCSNLTTVSSKEAKFHTLTNPFHTKKDQYSKCVTKSNVSNVSKCVHD